MSMRVLVSLFVFCVRPMLALSDGLVGDGKGGVMQGMPMGEDGAATT